MMTLLALLGGALGLAVTGTAVLLAWSIFTRAQARKGQRNNGDESEPAENPSGWLYESAPHLLKWTYFDYALFALFIIGSLFLFTDLIAVLRDADQYPPYHFAYLLCGFVFTLSGMMMLIVRLALTLSLVRMDRGGLAPNHHDHPSHAEHAE
ncbi:MULTISPECIES: hypothetical protein [unclassified Paenibacillus]|uniref:hypothetical protein n=1 Tax=unclassified Paenibacillus TaxID=185978 RepID=UPI001AE46C7E|nr:MULTISPECIES: hypothetical protein [unclassified Paenibacillus]MBP1154814.1 putative membrane protein [Paenibacillus sp. PvP091]MBP1169802.1 putative membrane protein [Paenibacillus sp. PvR098]MBP2440830.1 putative membrane protein [Paenibacillus sp. PvP052]